MYWKVLNIEMNLWELAIHLKYSKYFEGLQRICGDFIFTAACHGNYLYFLLHDLLQWLAWSQLVKFSDNRNWQPGSAKYCQAPQEFCQPH